MKIDKEILSKLKDVYLWDENYQNKTKEIILEFLNKTDIRNSHELMKIIMNETQGKQNPNVIQTIINDFLKED